MFKFEEFPEIMKAHKISEKFSLASYTQEFRSERKGIDGSKDKKWGQSIRNCDEFDENIYAEIIYNIFKDIKPILVLKKTGEKSTWDEIFKNDKFEDLDKRQRNILYMMVEYERPYRLPDEYYNNKDWFEEVKKKLSKVK